MIRAISDRTVSDIIKLNDNISMQYFFPSVDSRNLQAMSMLFVIESLLVQLEWEGKIECLVIWEDGTVSWCTDEIP